MKTLLGKRTLAVLGASVAQDGPRGMLLRGKGRRRAVWPPDLFAFAASVLNKTGDYSRVVDWNLSHYASGRADEYARYGEAYRERWCVGSPDAAGVLGRVFSRTCFDRDAFVGEGFVPPGLPPQILTAIDEIAEGRCDIGVRLLDLLVFADAFSAGFGLPYEPYDDPTVLDVAWVYAMAMLLRGADPPGTTTGPTRSLPSLASDVVQGAAVFPKQHTPQVGITVRSLSHNLALVDTNEVRVRWWVGSQSAPTEFPGERQLNILLAPWPLTVRRDDFVSATPQPNGTQFGLFDFKPAEDVPKVETWFRSVIESAELRVRQLDVVMFPELALSASEFEAVARVLEERHPKCGLMAGLNRRSDGTSCNQLQFVTSMFREEQSKHHRWRLDGGQVTTYGLARQLDPHLRWWENISIGERELSFFALSPDLVVTGLICEDLARQEPVAGIVRSIGPNLVLVPLMDGPQLPHRWSACYGTVLADDPGCSVLTLTSLGMVNLSDPPDAAAASRAIALWRHPGSPARTIELPPGKEFAVLSVSIGSSVEWSADGRSDYGASSVPRFRDVIFPPFETSVAGANRNGNEERRVKLVLTNERDGALVAFLATIPRENRDAYRGGIDGLDLGSNACRLAAQLFALDEKADPDAYATALNLDDWGEGVGKTKEPGKAVGAKVA